MGKSKRRSHDHTATVGDHKAVDNDWLAELVKKSTSAGSGAVPTTKRERILQRQAKKRRREKRKSAHALPSTHAQLNSVNEGPESDRKSRDLSRRRLLRFNSDIQAIVDTHTGASRRPYQGTAATANKKRKWEASSIQPRPNDYGGIGLARRSLFIELEDPSFYAQLEQEFREHVPGFFGKQRTKAMKKQLNIDMLWKKMASKKDLKIGGKRLADMKPDDRVEAMIKAGML